MDRLLLNAFKSTVSFAYGLLTLILYIGVGIRDGLLFKRPTEKETLELQLARNRLWDLSKPWCGLSHHILTLRDGFKFHYVCNGLPGPSGVAKPLVIFFHGFPDSWAVWRNILASDSLQQEATIVAIDLPGYGGSDSLDRYTATNVLEALTEFIITIRVKCGVDTESGARQQKTIIVAHDWGCVLAMRLAAEAPELADRFVLTNGPLIPHYFSNMERIVSSSVKMIKSSLRSPIQSRSTLWKAIKALVPVARQIGLSGYIFAMQLPLFYVRYLGSGGNYFFLKGVHQASYRHTPYSAQDAAECMASSIGPSTGECRTQTPEGDEYPMAVTKHRSLGNFEHMARYYREGLAITTWHKSVQTIADLHGISSGVGLGRVSSGTGLFDNGPKGALKACATVLWGADDMALNPQLCLDGMSDYLVANSQVIELNLSGHFTPLERESAGALEQAIEWAVAGEKEDVGDVVQKCYPTAIVKVRK